MLSDQAVAAIALNAAKRRFQAADIEDALSEATIDFDGDEALQITIVTKNGTFDRASDDAIVETLVDIRMELQKDGETRFPFVRYGTREDLLADVGP